MTDSDPATPLSFFNPAAFAFDTEMAIALIADMQIRKAIERGEFDDLPGSGKPLDLPAQHDPDWWLKSLMRREKIVMLPPSIQLRKDDAALDEQLDRLPNETAVRREVEPANLALPGDMARLREHLNPETGACRIHAPDRPRERTLPDSGSGLAEWWAEHGTVDDWASQTYAELIERAGSGDQREPRKRSSDITKPW